MKKYTIKIENFSKDTARRITLKCMKYNLKCLSAQKTQQWPQDWKRSVFIPIPKNPNMMMLLIAFLIFTSWEFQKEMWKNIVPEKKNFEKYKLQTFQIRQSI